MKINKIAKIKNKKKYFSKKKMALEVKNVLDDIVVVRNSPSWKRNSIQFPRTIDIQEKLRTFLG